MLVLTAGFGMYLFTVSVYGVQHRWAALVAATAYMYAPYLLTNTYVHGTIAEVAALAWLPWVFWSIRHLLTAKHPARAVLAVTLTLSGLALTHDMALFASVVLAATSCCLVTHGAVCQPARLDDRRYRRRHSSGHFSWRLGFRATIPRRSELHGGYCMGKRYGWTWHNIVQPRRLSASRDEPFNLGLTQVVLALVGLVVAQRRDTEWLFFIALALLGCFLGSP